MSKLETQYICLLSKFIEEDLILKEDESTTIEDDIEAIKKYYKDNNIKNITINKINESKNQPKRAYIKYFFNKKESQSLNGIFSNAILLFMIENEYYNYSEFIEAIFMRNLFDFYKNFVSEIQQ